LCRAVSRCLLDNERQSSKSNYLDMCPRNAWVSHVTWHEDERVRTNESRMSASKLTFTLSTFLSITLAPSQRRLNACWGKHKAR
jgi:hypothetical protein